MEQQKLPQLKVYGTPVAVTKCPSCGTEKVRSASSWHQNIYAGELRCTFSCGSRKDDTQCFRVFIVVFNLHGTHMAR